MRVRNYWLFFTINVFIFGCFLVKFISSLTLPEPPTTATNSDSTPIYYGAQIKSLTEVPGPAQDHATTFKVCDKVPAKVTPRNFSATTPTEENTLVSLVTNLKEYKQNQCTRVIQGTDFGTSTARVEPAGKHGFIGTVIQAYARHHNLVIRPDDIWIAIISQFALYVNGNAEKYRERFVNFAGKKQLVVRMGTETLDSISYAEFVEEITEKMHENIIDKEVRDWITPNFTTTTSDDKVVAGVVLMATFKKYFEYGGRILCGIPQITLEGTEDDWRNIAGRLIKLRTYGLESWVDDMLQPIVQQFIAAKLSPTELDTEFWNNMVHTGGMCGGTTVGGWITAFSVFNPEGKRQGRKWPDSKYPRLDINQIVSDVVYADVVICESGKRYDTVMFAGHLGQQIVEDGFTLRPRLGWAIAQRTSITAEGDYDTVVIEDRNRVC